MTTQESFKKRIRSRMEKTGERYVAARRSLIESSGPRSRTWAAEPEAGNDAVLTATGKGWDEWCDIIDAGPGHDVGHPAIASWLQTEQGLDGWWAQQITGGYERITGLRLPHQMPDGTFTANKSRTVTADAAALDLLLRSTSDHADLFPGWTPNLVSRADAKAIRIEIGPGVATFAVEAKPDGRAKVTIAHSRLPTFDDVEEWKFYWSSWLDAIG